MSGASSPIIFYPVAILMILFSFLAIRFKNVFYSLLSAVIVFFLAGVIFYLLGSEYNAVIQVAIYGVAVPVILGLAVMFTDFKQIPKIENKSDNKFKYILLLSGIVFLLGMLFVISPYNFDISLVNDITHPVVISAIGHGIFVKYVWAFELFSVVLTIIIVGLTVLNKDLKQEDNLCKK